MANNKKEYRLIISNSANDRMAEHFEFLARVSETGVSPSTISDTIWRQKSSRI